MLFITGAYTRITAAGKWLTREGRWKYAILGLLVAVSVLSVKGCMTARDARDQAQATAQAAQEQVEAADQSRIAADRAVTGAQAAKAAITTNELAGNIRMENALDVNEDWAAQPVPADVLDSLRD